MSLINKAVEVLHRIRVKLYPNYLTTVQGKFIARTNSEATLTIEDICAALKNRGGFTGNYSDLVDHVKQFYDELAYQLCDGFNINVGYFSIHPHVGGTFDKVNEGYNENKHPVTFRFRTLAQLRALAEHIVIDIEGLADVRGYIDGFTDVTTGSINETLTPGGMFSISGHKIRVMGKDADVGVYFVSVSDSTQRVKVDSHFAENKASMVIGMIPSVLTAGAWKLEIKTQFTGSGSTGLKSPRTIESAVEFIV
ncbi:MAG: DUF4469 domain-containing protein [Treponema sp.]|jgi:hypothetical protein|nr:DUF4469 domain-containing protein [Treponema sp.]